MRAAGDEPDGSLGGILAWLSTIHHEPSRIGIPLAEFARTLRPGGGLLLGYFDGEIAAEGTFTGGAVPLLGDTAPHVWTSGHPYNHEVHGVDVSRYQGGVDWNRARQAGISFAFIKATEGGDHSDPAFPVYWAQTRAAGIPRGAYHFYYFCRPAREQAEWFIRNVPKVRGALPPVLDVEFNHQSNCKRRWSREDVLDKMQVFMDRLERHYGQRPIIYTTVDFYRDTGVRSVNAEFWLRSVAAHPRERYPNRGFAFWQYSGTGTARRGVETQIDLNVFNGTEEGWHSWLAQNLSR